MSGENGNGQQIARKPDRTPLTQRDPVQLATHFWQSGYFRDVESMSQAVVKIVAGEELGLGPMTSMQGIHIIKGKPSFSANLLAAQVKRSGKYNYRVREATDQVCRIEWYEDSESVGESKYTIEQAKQAGLLGSGGSWEKVPEDMLFARCLTRGVRRFCPDVTAGVSAYVPEELGAEVDEQGEVISVPNLEPDRDEAVDAVEPLDPGVVEGLVKGIEFLGLDRDAVNLTLGSLGIDALDGDTEELPDALALLNPDDAEKLSGELQRMATAEGEGATSAT